MRRNLSHIIAAAFNEPLLLEPAYARVFFCALGREMGAASLSVPQQQVQFDAPGMLAETDEYMAGGKRPARVYRVVNGIAVLPVTGTLVHRLGGMRPFSGMTGYDGIVACLQQAMADSQVRGVLLDIDSPGGQAAGAFDCADMIYRLRQQKPVWALCNDTACSAAMLLASACSRRLVTQTSRIGSIGVMMSHVSYAGNLAQAGVDMPQLTATEAAVQENQRVMGILTCQEAKGREQLATMLAGQQGMSVEQARAILTAAAPQQPVASAQSEADRIMACEEANGREQLAATLAAMAVATGALAYAWYQGDATLSEFNKTLVLSGNQAGLTADRMLTLSRAGQAAGLTFNQARESLAALVNAGVRGGEQFDAINQSVARFASASGVEVDKVAEAFGKLTTDPTSGLMAMARQFRNVTAEQIAYVAQLQRSGDEAGALQAANDIATKGFDEQTRRLKENMGTLETWADKTGKAFKSMWDAILDIGRPESSADMLASAQRAFDEADKKWQWYQSRSQRRGKTSSFRANLQGAWDDRENARLGLAAATLQSDMEKAGELAARDRAERESSQLKYTGEAQKAYERLQTPLDKYTARQKELNKALKDGKILQADYNTLMASAKKDYESTLKKPSGVKVSAGERQEDRAHAALLALETELRTLEKHSGVNEKISQQRRDLWEAESQYVVLKEAATKRQLSEQEKSLLAHEKETLEYKRQLAELGDKIEHQKRLNELAQQAARFEQQQSAKQAAISAKARGLTDRQAQRESEEQRLREVYGDNPAALAKATSALKNTWSAEEQLRGSWMAGMKSGWGEWAESATDSFSQVKSVATQTFER